ncbi:MAG: phosphoribosylformylglycinamidine cyclo-ligase [Clostridiales bacterium]|nr:phosphoribosylformylglycinamidine cyclo-ligase [Clostridiales bacterium]
MKTNDNQKSSDAYRARGVSATKDEVHAAIKTQAKGIFPGAFCKIIEDPCGDPDYCAAMHADGAGTKSALAYIKYRETGDLSAYFDLAQDSAVMNLDDLLCIGAAGGFVMSNTIGRNAHRVGGEAIAAVIEGYQTFVDKMRNYGVDIEMSGGETADVGDLVGTLIVDSTFFVRMKRSSVIDCANIRPGDVIVGLASFGKAIYEERYNAGMGSNGLTAARHLLLCSEYADKYPETYSSTIDKSMVYSGKYRLGDRLPGADVSVGDAILSPTRTYAPIIKRLIGRDGLQAMIHCTGGGQVKCRSFGKGIHYIKDNLFEMPPLFRAIAESGQIHLREMYQVFNMGHRIELYCTEEFAKFAIETAASFGVDARIIGRTEEAPDGENRVTIKTEAGQFEY